MIYVYSLTEMRTITDKYHPNEDEGAAHRGVVGFDFTSLEWLQLHHRVKRLHREGVIADLGILPGSHWIDIGCGPGLVSTILAQHVGQHGSLTGVDLDPSLLEYAEANSKQSTLRYLQADAGSIPTKDSTFDGAYCSNTLAYVDDCEAVLREFRRIVKPGGRVIGQHWDDTLWSIYPLSRSLQLRVLAGVAKSNEQPDPGSNFDTGFGLRMHASFVNSGLVDVATQLIPFRLAGPLSRHEINYIRANALWLVDAAMAHLSPADVLSWREFFNKISACEPLAQDDVFFCEFEVLTIGFVPETGSRQ